MADEQPRFCVYDDGPVKRPAEALKIIGRGAQPTTGWVHATDNVSGSPVCRRKVLEESETYTVGESSGFREE